jgi:hypothetical protein
LNEFLLCNLLWQYAWAESFNGSRRRVMRKIAIVIFFLFSSGVGLYACEMHFSLLHPDGSEQVIFLGKSTVLKEGKEYLLRVQFVEDHRRCLTPPEETVYLLNDEKWKSAKEHLPLILLSQSQWEEVYVHTWEQEIRFKAQESGEWELQIVRDCPKGGYEEQLTILVR